MRLLPLSRPLLWDYGRGSLPYDVFCVMLRAFVFFIPPSWLGDPMVVVR